MKTGAIAKFGNGTIKIYRYLLKSRYGGQVELTQCRRRKIGAPVGVLEKVPESAKIVLDFGSLESLDVFINHLVSLRDELANESEG